MVLFVTVDHYKYFEYINAHSKCNSFKAND